MAKVSIIIPIYNVEKYVRKCIESVINQSEKDIEILLVDDGSTDSSGKICEEYAELDQRVQVIHKKNGGLSSARNCGTGHATSEYVQFLDGDDFLRADAVEVLCRVMQQYPSDFVQFMYQEVNEDQEPIVKALNEKIYQAYTSQELFENLYRLGGVAASGATKFMRKELALRIPFENIQHEDEMWCTKAFQEDLTVTYIQDELYYYVMREGSIIHSGFNRKKLDRYIISEERIKVLQTIKLNNLVCCEYGKLFHLILSLYNEARNAGDSDAVSVIHTLFEKQKSEIRTNAHLCGKFFCIFKLMCRNFRWIDIYRIYWKVKRN